MVLGLVLAASSAVAADQAAAFFDDTAVREIRLYFDDTNWYNTLLAGHRSTSDPYYPCRFQSGSINLPRIGCRFKGNSSFQRNGIKKPFKLDFNEYDDNATFMGLKKLNLNNFDLSPDFMREKLLHDMAGKYVAALRSVYVRLYVNDVFYGLYLGVEQPDKTMMQSRFGDDEDGNLYEGEERMGAGARPDLAWLGTDQALYRSVYVLETNEEANDFSGLVDFLNVLNNTPLADLPSKIEPIADIDNLLTWSAINNIVVNLDSYLGAAAEYYIYDRSKDGKFIYIQWDHNESFGITGDGTPRITVPATTDPFWLPPANTGGPGGGTGTAARPMLTRLWAVDAYKRLYLQAFARVLRGSFNPTILNARIDQLAAMIREHVTADPNKAYTASQFETNLNTTVATIPGLREFLNARYNYLRTYLNGQTAAGDIRLNKLAGGDMPTVEVYNLGPGTISLNGYYLSDDPANLLKWPLPAQSLADGASVTVPFTAQAAGGTLYLYSAAAGPGALDRVTYPALRAGQSYGRQGWFGSEWKLEGAAAATVGTGVLKINELMADNKTTLQDPAEAGAFEDWYNPGTAEIDMVGMYLTDDPTNPKKYRIPSSVKIAGGGRVVFWADNDTGQGATHTNFALDADREQIQIYDTDGATLIDSVSYTTQQEDFSFGRTSDGADSWSMFRPATPGTANVNPLANWVTNAASFRLGPLAPAAITSAFGQGLTSGTVTAAAVPLPTTLGGVSISIVDSANTTHSAPLYFVSAGQVNFYLPSTVAAGRARITLRKQDGGTLTGDLLIAAAGPGLFSTAATGEGAGLLAATRVSANGAQTAISTTPLNLGAATDQVYLTLYGTGIRGATALSQAKAQVGDVDIPALYAGAQPDFTGLDQVNIGPLPRSLAGKGTVEVELTVNGTRANRVTITIE